MTKTRKARIGSISTGTLRDIDLIEAFSNELASITGNEPETAILLRDCKAWLDTSNNEEYSDGHDSMGSELIEALEDALQKYAPPYCYFGSIEGDGADFGFWLCMEQVDELPRVKDNDEAKELGEDCVLVNDHGNITVFGGDGSVIWDCV